MPDIFTRPDDRKALVDDVAARMGIAPWVVDKDLWVCWSLARLGEIPGMPAVTFKGGTSLSKVHRLIERFSEDIDLTFSRDGWGFEGERDPLNPQVSRKKRGKLLDELKEKSEGVVYDVVVPGLIAACDKIAGRSGWSVELDPGDTQTVVFRYPQPAATYGVYGLPQVKIEFGARGDPWPTSRQTIRPYIEEVHADRAATAVAQVSTLNPERTFWEKITLLHSMYHATVEKPQKGYERHSRHIYDVHRIWRTPALREIVAAGQQLLEAVTMHKMAFFEDRKSRYELVLQGHVNCTPHEGLERTMRADFEKMREMFFSEAEVPGFEEMKATLGEVEGMVKSWKARV